MGPCRPCDIIAMGIQMLRTFIGFYPHDLGRKGSDLTCVPAWLYAGTCRFAARPANMSIHLTLSGLFITRQVL